MTGSKLDPSQVGGSAAPVRGRRLHFILRQLYQNPTAAFGTMVFLLFLVLALTGPLIAPYGVNQQIPAEARQPPSVAHLFGTDNLGRDVFSRVLLGAREILVLAGMGTLAAVLVGTVIGLVSAYQGGWLDEVVMRFFDGLLALPALLFALLLLGIWGPSNWGVLVVLFIVYTPIVARVVRSVVLSVKTKGYVEAARLRGESRSWILFKEIQPSVQPILAVETALRFSYAIFLVASLGFLGVGVQPPSPNWGLMVKEARETFNQVPWALYFPAAAISILVIGVNLMADGLKKVLQEPVDE